MKVVVMVVIFSCLVLPVFSQDANVPRYKSLSDAMGTNASNGNDKLKDFDQRMVYNANGKVYAEYKQKNDSLTRSLQESEIRMNRLLQSHEHSDTLKQERERYNTLLQQLNTLKSDYDQWLGSVQQ